MIGEFVIVRTRSAGVHCGYIQEFTGHSTCLILKEGRRIWRWRGANTLNEVSLCGIDESYSRISEPVPTICLTEAIEVIPCSEEARKNLSRSRWGD
jgi:hypothetical protein